MDFLKYRVKVMEGFKDGNVLEGRFLKPGEVLVVSEQDYTKIVNSGGILEIMDSLIPNPKKESAEVVAQKELQIAEIEEEERNKEAEEKQASEVIFRQEAEDQKVAPKKRGRPRKNVA